ncbi:unnamed protein product [Trichobilharzia szidati]|nr:unnamed protein product [Trichobilharzia szidati]
MPDGVEEKNTSEGVKNNVSNVSVKSDHIQLSDESTTSSPSNVSSSKCSLINKVNWKSFYRQDLHTQCNWRNGGPWQPIVAPAHHNHVITCLEVYEEWAITGSDDSSICVWNINTGQCLINLFGHLGGVWSMTVIPGQFYPAKKDYHPFNQYPLLISGSCDRTARVWQLDGHRWPCIATLFGHQSTVRCLASQKPCCAPKFVLNNTHNCNCNVSENNPSTLGPDVCPNDNNGDAFVGIDNFSIIGDNISEKEYILPNISANKGNDGNDNGHHCDNAYGNLNVNLINNRSASNKPDSSEQIFKQETFENSHLVVTGSRDTTLRLWNVLTGECVQEFRGHRGAIRCVQFTGDQIVSGSYDCTIRLWCALQGHCLRVFSAHTNRVYTLLFDGYHIISGSLDTTIRIWNVQTGLLEQTFHGHRSLTSELVFGSEQNILVSSNADETIRVWHIHTGKCIHILAGPHKHQSAVTCVQLTRNFIISSGDDGTVKLWDKRSGAYIRDLLRLDGAGRGGVIWRIVASEERLICAAGSRIGMEPTKLVILRFQEPQICSKHSKNKAYTINHICRPRQKYAPEPRLSQILCTNLGTN